MILIDTPCNGYSHLVATTIAELHTFAQRIGIKKCWYSNKHGKNQPHYDLKGTQIAKAIAEGAKYVTHKELFDFLKQTYG